MAVNNPFDIKTGGNDFTKLSQIANQWRAGAGADKTQNKAFATEAVNIANNRGLNQNDLATLTGFSNDEIGGSLKEFGLTLNPTNPTTQTDYSKLTQLGNQWRAGAGADPMQARGIATEAVSIANRLGMSQTDMANMLGFTPEEVTASMAEFGLQSNPTRPGLVAGQLDPTTNTISAGSYDATKIAPPEANTFTPVQADPTKLKSYEPGKAKDVVAYAPEKYTAQGYDAGTYDATGYTAGTRDATTYQAQTGTAQTMDVTPEMMVENRITGIIDRNSDLSRSAEARSLAQMNARGLSSSSMAVGAGQRAVIDSAMPIAMADAKTLVESGRFNVEQANIMEQFNKGQLNAAAAFNADATNQAASDNQAALNRAAEFMAQADNLAKQTNVQEKNKAKEFYAEAANAAADAYANAQNNALSLEAQAQNARDDVVYQEATRAAQYAAEVANTAYNNYVQAQNQAKAVEAQSRTQIGIAQYETVVKSNEAALDRALTAATANQNSADAKALRELDAKVRGEVAAAEIAAQKAINDATIAGRTADTKLEIEGRSADAAKDAAARVRQQALMSVSEAGAEYTRAVSDAYNNPDLDTAAKQTAVENALKTYKTSVNVAAVVSGIDGLYNLISFDEAAGTPTGNVAADTVATGPTTGQPPATGGLINSNTRPTAAEISAMTDAEIDELNAGVDDTARNRANGSFIVRV